ncbi:MAG: hypothetical protein HWD84_08860 [Flavobacteriaceae bacterium]|nr:hypothetical protein [Flavobacteriaceae bacterium]
MVRSILSAQPFDEKKWEARLVSALEALSAKQKPFLEAYWQANGYPTQFTYNGRDETPFPSDDLYDIYESARHAERFGNAEYYQPLRSSLDPVRGVLHAHPSLARALGRVIGNDDLQVGILNHSSLVSLSRLIVGQMAWRNAHIEKGFEGAAADLSSLLLLANGSRSSPLPGDLDVGLDVALFHGAHFEDTVDLGEGYALLPFSELGEYIDNEWLEDIAPEQIRHRNWQSVFAIVHSFRWKPAIRPKTANIDHTVRSPHPLFQRWVVEFANLLAASVGKPITWMMTLEGCVSRSASELLGMHHSYASAHRGRSINHLFDPFKKEKVVDYRLVDDARFLFAKRRETAYPELAPCVQRLAEALARDGRYAAEDRILDLAVVLELLFKPSGKRISLDLQNSIADLLGSDNESRDRLKHEVKHFYDVRSAIIHGPSDEKKKRLRTEVGQAFQNGFEIARKSLLRKLG